jgi:hypothetical protein
LGGHNGGWFRHPTGGKIEGMDDREHPKQQQQRTLILPATVVCGLWWGIAPLAVMGQAPNGEKAAGAVDYLKQVKPLLRERCYACHGPLKQKAGLRLDTAALAIKGGDSGSAVKPGDAAGSLLLERVSAIRGIAFAIRGNDPPRPRRSLRFEQPIAQP